MSDNKQRISQAFSKLEREICSRLNTNPLATGVRNPRLRALQENAGKGTISEAAFKQAANQVGLRAPDRKAFAEKLTSIRQKRGVREFVELIKALGEDEAVLGALTVAPPSQPVSSSHLPAGTPMMTDTPLAMNGAKTNVGGMAAVPSTMGFTTPPPSVAAVQTPVAANPSLGPEGGRKGSQQAAGAPEDGFTFASAGNYQQGSPDVKSLTSEGQPSAYQSNPFYGQDVLSPLQRARDYTPTLAMKELAIHHRQAPPKLFLGTHGDLFDQSNQTLTGQHHISRAGLKMPSWQMDRPYLTGLCILDQANLKDTDEPPGLISLPVSVQEAALVNDLLYAFLGLSGTYIGAERIEQEGRVQVAFCYEGPLDPCLQELVDRVLPICEYVLVLQRFVETRSGYTHSSVSQAVAAALRALLQDWYLMVTQMEHQLRLGQLSLQALVFYCQEPLASLCLLASFVTSVSSQSLTSAGILNELHHKCTAIAGDLHAQALMQRLLRAACAPYFAILETWLCEGVINDPYQEFMIHESKSVSKESSLDDQHLRFWRSRYVVREVPSAVGSGQGGTSVQDVPVFLKSAVQEVLTTGKYLNCIRECGQPVVRPLPPGVHLLYDPSQAYLQQIQQAHAAASRILLSYVRKDVGLESWLHSIKHYYLLDQGDLVVYFLEHAKDELKKPAKEISRPRLQSLLELAVKTCSVANDPHSDSLSFTMDPRSPLEVIESLYLPAGAAGTVHLHKPLDDNRLGLDLFMVNYKLQWPLTLIVSSRQLTQYQLLFRHIFRLKYIERGLSQTWQMLRPSRYMSRPSAIRLKLWCVLCYQLMFFIQEYLRYFTFDILEPLWHHMITDMRKAENIDQVMSCHHAFLDRVLAGSLLTEVQTYKHLAGLADLTQKFCRSGLVVAAEAYTPKGTIDVLSSARARLNRQKASVLPTPLEQALQDDETHGVVHQLQGAFTQKVLALVEALRTLHALRKAGARGGEGQTPASREELDSLQNFIDRLDFRKTRPRLA